ncbi:MAG: hypothetical protein KatS3mg009_0652 [Acidimicrobiia bacterium]|nr:MAG: hypothetical protein KatS3mg009_0652 [Acidimicrobiia bacterium]
MHELISQGHDVRRVADDLLRTLRDAFLVANAGGRVPYEGPEHEAEALAALARDMGNAALVRAIELLGQAIVDVRQQTVADPRLVLEVAVVRVARRESRSLAETLVDRVERLERQLAGGASPPTGPAPASGAPGAAAPAAGARAAPAAGGPVLARRAGPRPAADRPAPAAPGPQAPPVADPPAASGPQAPPGADPQAPPVLDLDTVIEVWPRALGALKTPVRAAIQDAQPVAIEHGAIVFGVPKRRYEAIGNRFRAEADSIKAAFAAELGFQPKFLLRPHDFDAPGAFRAGSGSADAGATGAGEDEEDPDDEQIDLTELEDAPDAPPPDTIARLVDDLGAQVVEERPRN